MLLMRLSLRTGPQLNVGLHFLRNQGQAASLALDLPCRDFYILNLLKPRLHQLQSLSELLAFLELIGQFFLFSGLEVG